MAIPAAITGGIAIYQGYKELSAGGEEPRRLAENEAAYNEAVAGDADALAFLLARSVQGQTVFVSGYGEVGGWATASARADAASKYQQAKAALGAQSVAGTVVGSQVAQGVAQFGGSTIVPGTKSDITVLLIAGAVAVFFLARMKR